MYSNFNDFKAIDKKDLPKEYGGTIPIKELSGEFDWGITASCLLTASDFLASLKGKLLEKRELLMIPDEMTVRKEMYPKQVLEGSVKSLKVLLNSPDMLEKFKCKDVYGIQGMQGSFRKLEID